MTGQMKGSMANFITTTRNGENVIKSKPFNTKDPNTPAQQMQRGCFRLLGEEHQSLGGITAESFPEGAANQTAYIQFVTTNLPDAFDRTGTAPFIDYTKLVVANGSLPIVIVTEAVIVASGITISYQTNMKIPRVNADDQVLVVAKTQVGELILERQVRGEAKIGTIAVDYPGITASDIKCCYVFVLNADGSKASKSVYVPIV